MLQGHLQSRSLGFQVGDLCGLTNFRGLDNLQNRLSVSSHHLGPLKKSMP